MIVLKVENIKEFMAGLLTDEMFDKFHVSGCEVATFVTFQSDGKRHMTRMRGHRMNAARFCGNS